MKKPLEYAGLAVGLLLLTLFVFREVLPSGYSLFTTDDNLGSLMLRKAMLPAGWFSGWSDAELLGSPAPIVLNLTSLLLAILPASFFNNWINAFDLVVGSFFFVLFLRGRGVAWPAAVVGMLTAYWLGSNFTLVYAGHIGKFGILLWVPVFLWLTDRAARQRSIPLAILAGGAMGAQFLEQADVALFFALALGPYALYACGRENGRNGKLLARIAVPLFATALLLAVHPLLSGYATAVEDVAAVQDDDPQARWDFVTQWSWPPEESIDFVAPGFYGWRSGEPAGPYVGRMGRSAGWEETGQGFQNFKLENQYLGVIPIMFAILALYLVWHFRDERPPRSGEVWFWGGVTLLALLLSFGKYVPLYALFYQLPIVSAIRNPNKFLQVFQLALAVLAAYGFDDFLQRTRRSEKSILFRDIRPVVIGTLLMGLFLLIWGIGSAGARETLAGHFQPWGPYASTIVSNRIGALLHGGAMALLATAWLFALCKWHARRARLVWMAAMLVPAAVLFDVCFLARHYVVAFEAGTLEETEVVRILKNAPEHRVALVTQEDFYNNWLSILFPYHGISTINVAQMPRMPTDYQRYLSIVGRHPLRFWQLGAVRYILGPAPVWQQISQQEFLRDRYELVFAYNVQPAHGGVRVMPATDQQPGHHVVIRQRAPHPRYALIQDWRVVDDDSALARLVAPDFEPFQTLLIAADQTAALELPPPQGSGIGGSVTRRDYRSGYARLRVSAEYPSILRIADKYDPHWHATLNGERVPLLRVDYLHQGVWVPAGLHHVELTYRPPHRTRWIQAFGMIVVLSGGVAVVIERRRRRNRE